MKGSQVRWMRKHFGVLMCGAWLLAEPFFYGPRLQTWVASEDFEGHFGEGKRGHEIYSIMQLFCNFCLI